MPVAFYAPMKPPTHTSPSGDRRMARLLLTALRDAGYNPWLASVFRSFEGRGDPVRQAYLAEQGAREVERILRHVEAMDAAQRPAAWFTYHLHYKAPDWLGPAISKALGIPYLIAEASHAPKRAGGPWDFNHRAVGAAITAADLILCVTHPDMECVKPLLADPSRLDFLPPFIDAEPFSRAAEHRLQHRRDLSARWNLDHDVPWLLTVAMMRPGDKLESYRRLAAALERLFDLPWRLVVVGDGEAQPQVRTTLKALGPDRVFYAGRQEGDGLAAVYAAADIYVWPAAGEAYGMAFLEAQASGLPVVAGRIRGVPDVTLDGETALLAKENDAADFAEKLRRILSDRKLRRTMGGTGRKFVADQRNLDAASRRLAAALKTLSVGVPTP